MLLFSLLVMLALCRPLLRTGKDHVPASVKKRFKCVMCAGLRPSDSCAEWDRYAASQCSRGRRIQRVIGIKQDVGRS